MRNLILTALTVVGSLYAGVELAGASQQGKLINIISVDYSRDEKSEKISIHLQKEVSYVSRVLDRNSAKKKPYRLYVDLLNTSLPDRLKNIKNPHDSIISRIRIAQRNKSTTRIVFEIDEKIYREDYRISQFDNPAQIVIELLAVNNRGTSQKSERRDAGKAAVLPKESRTSKRPSAGLGKINNSIGKKNALPSTKKSDVFTIIIDPGHGGKDPGAIGFNNFKEKDVCLPIALEIKKHLDKNMQCLTVLTRDKDIFLSLKERGRIANMNKADFFISIHANSHEDATLTGIETYYLNFSSDDDARKVAARENFTTPAKISDLELILFDLMQSEKINKSSIFAGYIHNALVDELEMKYDTLRNLGVKHAPMRVLIEAEMPGVLIETAFISNPNEAQRLKSKKYHRTLSSAILQGLNDLKKNGHKTAYYMSQH